MSKYLQLDHLGGGILGHLFECVGCHVEGGVVSVRSCLLNACLVVGFGCAMKWLWVCRRRHHSAQALHRRPSCWYPKETP